MAITIFQVVSRSETLQNIEKLLKKNKKPSIKTITNPEGEEIDLKTTITNVKQQSSNNGVCVFFITQV